MPASIPSGPKCSLTSFPQCWHLISRTVHSVSVPSSSKMCRLHLGLGHLISSICHRLLPYSTPASTGLIFRLPVLICNKGTSLPLPVPFYPLCFIGFSHSFFARTTLNFHSIDTIANIYLLSNFYSCFLPSFFTHIKTTAAVAIRNSAKSISWPPNTSNS